MKSLPTAIMDCPICYDKITVTTGVTTLSCSHSFHLSCISGWFLKQEVGTCPCCRKEMAAIEDLPRDDESVYSDDSEDEEVEFTRADLQGFIASLGGNLSEEAADNICDVIAGFTYYELNALVVGNTGRQLTEEQWNELLDDDDDDDGSDDDSEEELEDGELEDGSQMTIDNMRITSFLNPDGSSTRIVRTRNDDDVWRKKVKAATKLQAVWRGFQGRVAMMELSAARILATMA